MKPIPLTVPQVVAILVSTNIGVGILPLPIFPVRTADHGAPLVTLLAFVLGFFALAIMSILGSRFPKQDFVTLSGAIIGKWPARFFAFTFAFYFALITAFTAREFGAVVITAVLKSTPLEVTVIVMLILGAISARVDINTFAYMHLFYLPFMLIPAWLIVFLSLKNAEPLNLLPIWGNENHGWLNGILTVSSLLQSSFIITLIIPYMKKSEKALAASFWSMVITGSLYVAIVAACVGVFGPEEIKILLWPTLELAKTTSLPVLERLDAAFLAVWLTAVFTTILSNYYMTIRAFSNVFRLRDYRALAFFLLPVIFIIAMLPQSIIQMYTTIYNAGRMGYLYIISYPAVLLLIAIVRRKRGNRDEPQQMDEMG